MDVPRASGVIPVEPWYLYSIREQASFTWRSMVCELIDNAFGANATTVRLSWPGGKVFRIEDDGSGIPDIVRMLTFGAKRDRDAADIGFYGVGAKHALIWLWGESTVRTKHGGYSSELTISWDDVASGRVPYPTDAAVVRIAGGQDTGTAIYCKVDKGYPKFADLLPSIASTYTPGIESGKRIIIACPGTHGGEVLSGRAWPETDCQIDDTIEAAGREVRIRMGIVSQGHKNPYTKGFSFERSFRVIKESTLGANGFSVSRIAARITLGTDWRLSTHKDDFAEFQDELAEAIYARCADLMQEASEQAMSLEDAEFNRELADAVHKVAGQRREKRPGASDEAGTVQPKETARRRTSATVSSDEPGSVIGQPTKRGARRGFTVESYEADSSTFGYYDSDGNRVRLNTSNRWLGERYRSRDQGVLLTVIYGILADHATRSDGKRNPLFREQIDGDFCANWGRSIESLMEQEAAL